MHFMHYILDFAAFLGMLDNKQEVCQPDSSAINNSIGFLAT